MRPTQILRSSGGGGPPNWKVGNWLGDWGNFGGTKQKGIIHWGISANRQNVLAGVGHDAIFNTFRRTRAQIGYWVPPVILGYYLLSWATEKNEYLNSKAGRAEVGSEE